MNLHRKLEKQFLFPMDGGRFYVDVFVVVLVLVLHFDLTLMFSQILLILNSW
jgi:hypothetical protein